MESAPTTKQYHNARTAVSTKEFPKFLLALDIFLIAGIMLTIKYISYTCIQVCKKKGDGNEQDRI